MVKNILILGSVFIFVISGLYFFSSIYFESRDEIEKLNGEDEIEKLNYEITKRDKQIIDLED